MSGIFLSLLGCLSVLTTFRPLLLALPSGASESQRFPLLLMDFHILLAIPQQNFYFKGWSVLQKYLIQLPFIVPCAPLKQLIFLITALCEGLGGSNSLPLSSLWTDKSSCLACTIGINSRQGHSNVVSWSRTGSDRLTSDGQRILAQSKGIYALLKKRPHGQHPMQLSVGQQAVECWPGSVNKCEEGGTFKRNTGLTLWFWFYWRQATMPGIRIGHF